MRINRTAAANDNLLHFVQTAVNIGGHSKTVTAMSETPLPNIFDLTPLNPSFNENPHALLDRLALGMSRPSRHAGRELCADALCGCARRAFRHDAVARSRQGGNRKRCWQKRIREERIEGIEMEQDEGRKGICFSTTPITRASAILWPRRCTNASRAAGRRSSRVVDEISATSRRPRAIRRDGRFRHSPCRSTSSRASSGVDDTRLAEFREWSEGVILTLNPFRTPEQTSVLVAAAVALSGLHEGTHRSALRRAEPRDDLVSDMVALCRPEGAPISDGELVDQSAIAPRRRQSHDDGSHRQRSIPFSQKSRGNSKSKLKSEPALINSAVEEVLRFEGPVDITGRIASRWISTFGGCPIRKTQSVMLSLRGANHDPEIFPDPHRFDISRKSAPHVAFGGGTHLCIGSPLARLEAQVALPRAVQPLPGAQAGKTRRAAALAFAALLPWPSVDLIVET